MASRKSTGVKILHVNVHGNYTKEQLEKMLTESRELTLMSAVPTIAARQKWNSRDPVSQHSDSRDGGDITNEGRLTARNMAAFIQ